VGDLVLRSTVPRLIRLPLLGDTSGSVGAPEDGRLVGAALDRSMRPSAVSKTGLGVGLSRGKATGAEVGSDDTASVKQFLTGPLAVSP
jgi:hypothetical protein